MPFDFTDSIIAAIAGLLGAFVSWAAQARLNSSQADKNEADEAQAISSAWSTLIVPIQAEMAALRRRVTELETQADAKDRKIEELECEIVELRKQILELGEKPRTRRKKADE